MPTRCSRETAWFFSATPTIPQAPGGAGDGGGAAQRLWAGRGGFGRRRVLLPFTDGRSCQSRLRAYPNLMVLRAFTKLYAMAGLRLGYLMCADEDLAGRIGAWGQSWSVSAPAQVAGLAAVSEEGWPERTRRFLRMERPWMTDALGALGFLSTLPTATFCYFRRDLICGTGRWPGA